MGCHGNHAFFILLQDLKLTKHWFSSFQDVILAEGMNGICATLRPPMTIFLMAGASTISSGVASVFLYISSRLAVEKPLNSSSSSSLSSDARGVAASGTTKAGPRLFIQHFYMEVGLTGSQLWPKS